MGKSSGSKIKPIGLRGYVLVLLALWTVFVGSVLFWTLLRQKQETLETARFSARSAFQKDLAYRHWAASHGGVYVPVTQDTPPNPYLADVEDRDVITISGHMLTLINPAYMIRQVHELGAKQYGLLGHITSLNPIRPENFADPWETDALLAFEQGSTEVSSIQILDGRAHMRLMRPLITEQSCLKCHASQGYKVGAIRGGISVAVPMAPLVAIAYGHAMTLTFGHTLLWLMGMVGIGLGTRRLSRRMGERNRATGALLRSEESLRQALQESQKRRAETTALLESARAVLEHRDFEQAARSIFDHCKNAIGATAGYVALLSKDSSGSEVVFLDSGGWPCTVDENLPMPLRGLRDKAYRSGKAVYDNDFSNTEWMRFVSEGHAGLDNVLFVPLPIGGEVVGLLGIANKTGGFDEHDARLASAFGELAAVALLNSMTTESLEHSENRFRSVVESANDAITTIDSQGKITFWNRGAENMFGYSAEEILGQPLTVVMPEQFGDGHNRVVSTLESEMIGKTTEAIGLRKDNGRFPLELSVATWKMKDQPFFTGIMRDITQRKTAEEQIKDLAKFPSESPYPVLRVSKDGTILYANNASVALLTEWGGQIGRSAPEYWQQLVTEALDSDQRQLIDIMHKDQVFALVFAPVKDAGYVNIYASDITERKQAEEAIRAEKDKAQEYLDIAGVILVVIDADQKVTLINKRGCEILQGTEQDIVGKNWFDNFVPEAIRDNARDAFTRLMAGDIKPIEHLENPVLTNSGEERIIAWHNTVIEDNAGNIVGTLSSGDDITERKQTEQEREITIKLFKIINSSDSMQDLMKQSTAFLQNWIGCDAVGIRYRDGDDFPYFQTRGFSKEFVETENSLCVMDQSGKLIRDSQGNPVLECMCGNVIRGRFDPSKAFFTANGSFWTNSTSELLTGTSQAERQGRTRNKCYSEGYESLALIPMRSGERPYGLLQFANKGKGLFTPELISQLERIADTVVIALAQRQAEQALKEAHDQLEMRVKERTAELAKANMELQTQITERKSAEVKLLDYQQQLRSLASELSLAEERERRRIATDLHDLIGQILAASQIKLETIQGSLSDRNLRKLLNEVNQLIKEAIRDTRSLIFDLSPPVLYEFGFEAALEWLAERTEKQHGIVCKFQDDKQLKPLNNDVSVLLFKAVRELLLNVVKHGKARNVSISLARKGQEILVEVQDDGVGFDTSEAPLHMDRSGGFGLFSIRERLDHIGGHFEVKSKPQQGTRATLSVPLNLEIQDQD